MNYQYINLDCLNAIADGDRDFKIEIIKKYLEKTPIYLDQIQNSLDKLDYESLFLDVHRFKGSVIFVGAVPFVLAAKDMELASKVPAGAATLHNMFDRIKGISAQADEELKHVLVMLEQEMAAEE